MNPTLRQGGITFSTAVELVDPGCPQPGYVFLLKYDVFAGNQL